MTADDIPQVLEIERLSFPSMWPRTLYQRELKNKLARYLVAYQPAPEPSAPPPHAEADGGRPLSRLLGRLFRRGPEPPRDRILGMVGLWCMVGEGHIVTIAVHPSCRRQGIGELLLVAALEAAVDAGQEVVTLECRISNRAARALYEKYGFSRVGVRARYYTDNQEDALIMTTPPLRSSSFRRLLAQRIEEQRDRWGAAYPLDGYLRWLPAPATP
jgi:ribosomal-protein-alanine N-acetyltransferase